MDKKPRGFIQKNEMQRIALGIVYEPDTVDLQGDFSTAEEIEKACHEFSKHLQDTGTVSKALGKVVKRAVSELMKGSKEVQIDVTEVMQEIQKGTAALGDMHESWNGDVGDVVENYIAPVDFTLGDQEVKKGTWLMAVQFEPEYFTKVQSGEITGWSMGGSGVRTQVSVA